MCCKPTTSIWRTEADNPDRSGARLVLEHGVAEFAV
jgi:hypothetical protein